VGLLANDVERVEPLWTGGGYSVWQIPGKKIEDRSQKSEFRIKTYGSIAKSLQ
jgi:hypothetical protein